MQQKKTLRRFKVFWGLNLFFLRKEAEFGRVARNRDFCKSADPVLWVYRSLSDRLPLIYAFFRFGFMIRSI